MRWGRGTESTITRGGSAGRRATNLALAEWEREGNKFAVGAGGERGKRAQHIRVGERDKKFAARARGESKWRETT